MNMEVIMMKNNLKRDNWNYYRLKFNVYKVEVGVLLDKDNDEYDFYLYYDKKQIGIAHV